jgi:formylglycine-generating enzyme required for sulfatase activity
MGHTQGMPSEVGSSGNEHPQHTICLKDYWIGMYEVTWYEYKQFIELGGYGDVRETRPPWWSQEGWQWRIKPPGSGGIPEYAVKRPDLMGSGRPPFGADKNMLWKGPWVEDGFFSSPPDDHPVVGLSWYEADAYCRFVGGRLPLEAEWEVAATWNPDSGRPQQFPWGNLFTFTHECSYGNTGDDPKYPGFQTSPVGMYPEGRSPVGCYDMIGNAFEWCADWYHPESYPTHSSQCGGNLTTPATMKLPAPVLPGYTPIPGFRAIRGGGYDPSFDGTFCQRGRSRGIDGAEGFRCHTYGVRVVWDQDPLALPQAQQVRPLSVSEEPPPSIPHLETEEIQTEVQLDVITQIYHGVIDNPGKTYWYSLQAQPESWVEIDLNANDPRNKSSGYSPLDAVIEIWHEGYEAPLQVLDDDIVPSADPNGRNYLLDPPRFQHQVPAAGCVYLKVRAYTWHPEGSQAGLPESLRSWSGPDMTFEISFRPIELPCYDLNGDGLVTPADLVTLVEHHQEKSYLSSKGDLNGDGFVGYRDLFALEFLWRYLGEPCPSSK